MLRLLMFIGFMAVATLMAYMLSVQVAPKPDSAEIASVPRDQMQFREIVIEQQSQGAVSYRIWAKRAAYHEKSNQTRLTDVRIVIYPQPGSEDETEIHGVADSAIVIGKAQKIHLINNAVVRRGDDMTIRGNRIIYDHKLKTIVIPKDFWLRDKSTIHTGRQLNYKLTDRKASFKNPRIVQ